jgi:nicotinamidase-related amidase
MPTNSPLLKTDSTVLLVVDIQERLLPAMHESEACLAAAGRTVEVCRVLDVPIVATEQYPAGLGPTCPVIRERWGDVQPVEKMRFSACVEPVVARLRELGRQAVLVTGIEAHVCVQQSVLELLALGYRVYVCADAVSSRRTLDRDLGLQRMRDVGAVVTTTESVIFELTGQAGTEAFKRILKIVK